MPALVSDDSVRRFCRCYRQSRIPCVTWRHPRTHSLLLRGAGHHGKSVMGMLKSHPAAASTSTETTTSSVEQVFFSKYFLFNPLTADIVYYLHTTRTKKVANFSTQF